MLGQSGYRLNAKYNWVPVADAKCQLFDNKDPYHYEYTILKDFSFTNLDTFEITSVLARCRVPYAVEENLREMKEWKNDRKTDAIRLSTIFYPYVFPSVVTT